MLNRLFSRLKPIEQQKVIVVSGLPRSGTSMMMRMLAEGGLPILTDKLRQADKDNPNGYYETEKSKSLAERETQWIYEARGKAIKVISYLLEYLPDDLTYDIVFMERNIGEVLASQKKMLMRRSAQDTASDDELALQYRKHLHTVKYWMAHKPNMRVIYVDYSKMVKTPGALCVSLAGFLGRPLDTQAMQAVPDQSLYRNRA